MKVTVKQVYNTEYISAPERLGFDFPSFCAKAGRAICKVHWLRNETLFQALYQLTEREGQELYNEYKQQTKN